MATPYGPNIGNALMAAAQIRGVQQREQMNALAMQDVMAQRQSRNAFAQAAPGLVDPNTRSNALMTVARDAPDALGDALEVVGRMTTQERAAASERAEFFGRAAEILKTVPYERRRQIIEVLKPQFAERGTDVSRFGTFDPTDENLQVVGSQALSTKEMIEKADKDRAFKAGRDDAAARQADTKATREATEAYRNAQLRQGDERNAIARTQAETQAAATLNAAGKMTNEQSVSAGFADRTREADAILANPAVAKAGMSYMEQVKSGAPAGLGNYIVSSEFQLYDQAARNFINAQLRRESGAVISPSEFDNARKQYLPQPGDSAAVLKQKASNRKMVIDSLARGAGPSYKPAAQSAPDAAPANAPAATAPMRARNAKGETIEWNGTQWVGVP